MELVKICPACHAENHISEVMCRCMADISSVPPTPKKGKEIASAEKDGLELRCKNSGETLIIRDGEELGRDGGEESFFTPFPTVSRHHARITNSQNLWQIEDLNSTNGTWINGVRLQPKTLSPLKNGDILQLSKSCSLEVRL
ncbi:MAG: FHA domain-containing protein [Synergistaceae bacterium]|nr:FHA domain-containing protein [Synergistaceae bacterium]MBP9626112.1 FHA domain-containing protein [Synergistaceae bacterium]MBP9958106.1 FHA domain-containing protein [Synergistaceae bacterium]